MRVLIADDDVSSRLLLQAMVSRFGHECLVATDGRTAWDLLSRERIDVLITDWTMSGIDGPELCRRVRGRLGDTYVYVVLITGLDEPERVLEGMNAGADDYLVKPVDRFTMQARLVAAERVTDLQRQVGEFRTKLEEANLELRSQSLTDALTGLGNRRRMEEDLARAHARALRLDRSYGVALFDIDHFKLYNDNYGHLAGDDALREVAHCLDGAVRAGESVYRYGGEEFLLLLPECDIDEVVMATVRICQAVSSAALPHEARPTSPRLVTLSAGVSCREEGSLLSAPDLLRRADKALYQAKSAGRNRVHVAPGGPSMQSPPVQ